MGSPRALPRFVAFFLSAVVLTGAGIHAQTRRDLSLDEAMGGHTLARHVGKSDAELAERLGRERQISAASTYTDRATAERSVGAALAGGGGNWRRGYVGPGDGQTSCCTTSNPHAGPSAVR